jgi:GDP-4-dehydro-6-deoxy-D-mannose reductase
VSKIAQEMLGIQYHFNFGLPIVVARPFNQFGPGQNLGFVAPDFAMQIARIEAKLQPPVMRVGDLSARRDFTDVRDIVRAQRLALEHGEPGETYNIGTGKAVSIKDLLNTLLRASQAEIEVQIAPEHMRPAKVPLLWGNASKLRAISDWQPLISFEQSLHDVLEDCRQRVQSSH